MKLGTIISLLLVVSATAHAQQSPKPVGSAAPKPVAPDGPLLQTAPEYSQWVVSYQYAEDTKKDQAQTQQSVTVPTNRPRKIVTTKTGKILREEVTDISGRSKDVWFDHGTQFTKHSESPLWLESGNDSGDSEAHPMPANGFRDLTGVSADNFAGTLPYSGGKYLVFVPGGANRLNLNDPSTPKGALEKQVTVTFVDEATRLPVMQRDYGDVRVYHFNTPPTDMQTLPSDLQEQIKKGKEGKARLQARAPRAY